MAGRPSIRNYIAAFFGHWSQSVSGGAGLIATAGALGVGEDQNTRLILGVAAALAFVIAAYQVWAFERKARNAAEAKLAALEDEYPHSLRLDAINANLGNRMDPTKLKSKKAIGREAQIILVMKNMIDRPVEYRMQELRVNGVATRLGNGGEVLGARATALFQGESLAVPLVAPNTTETFLLEMVYRYGKPGHLSRIVTKKTTAVADPVNNRLVYVNEIDEDHPCP